MERMSAVSVTDWQAAVLQLAKSFSLYAPVSFNGSMDYELIDDENAGSIVYNHPKPSTPLKTFFLPVRENVTSEAENEKQTVVMGAPACDLAALDMLDEMYLGRDFTDIYYKNRRETSIIIGYECNSMAENCHCTSCGINPFPEKHSDLSLVKIDGRIYLDAVTQKGKDLLKLIGGHAVIEQATENEAKRINEKREAMKEELGKANNRLPGYEDSGKLLEKTNGAIWEKYSEKCVSCGACATICPTCTCFLLIDRPGFEKIRQMDACQYPGFERVAAGEDPLGQLPVRFMNRYYCKYVWRPLKFKSIACTGCGRCIDTCIGKISKNELLEELYADKK